MLHPMLGSCEGALVRCLPMSRRNPSSVLAPFASRNAAHARLSGTGTNLRKNPPPDNEFFRCVKLEKKRHSWIEVLTVRLWRGAPKVDLLQGSFWARNLNHSLLVIPTQSLTACDINRIAHNRKYNMTAFRRAYLLHRIGQSHRRQAHE